MKSALVYGADEFFGLSFCEHLMEEGVSVDVKLAKASDVIKRLYFEERLMWLVRNQHFRLIEQELEGDYDKIFIQYTGCMPEEALDVLPENKPAFLLVYEHLLEDVKEAAEQKGVEMIVLPDMYGPWDIRNEDKENRESAFFVDDVAAQLAFYAIQKSPSPLRFERQTADEEAAAKIEEWKRQMTTFFDKK